jgi:hypothetical protein
MTCSYANITIYPETQFQPEPSSWKGLRLPLKTDRSLEPALDGRR